MFRGFVLAKQVILVMVEWYGKNSPSYKLNKNIFWVDDNQSGRKKNKSKVLNKISIVFIIQTIIHISAGERSQIIFQENENAA